MPKGVYETAPPPTVEEWFAKYLAQPLTNSEKLGWTHIGLYMSQIFATREFSAGPRNDDHFLMLIINGSTRLQSRLRGEPYDEYLTSGAMILCPGQNENSGAWSDTVDAAFVRLSPQLVELNADMVLRGDPAHVELLPMLNLHDPLLHSLIIGLVDEMRNPTPYSALFAESAAHMITLQLLRKYSTAKFIAPVNSAGLTVRQMRVVHDYVESNLNSKIGLSDLATLLFMSVPHFERLFRRSYGCAPYRYVMERRIERAKGLLANSGMTLYEVARQSGFANQSHLTKHFTRAVGVSPARYRGYQRS